MGTRVELGLEHWYQPAVNKDDVWTGIIVYHPIHADDEVCRWRGECGGWVEFDIPANQGHEHDKWQVGSFAPLDLSPSLQCHCGDHGHIKQGKWVSA